MACGRRPWARREPLAGLLAYRPSVCVFSVGDCSLCRSGPRVACRPRRRRPRHPAAETMTTADGAAGSTSGPAGGNLLPPGEDVVVVVSAAKSSFGTKLGARRKRPVARTCCLAGRNCCCNALTLRSGHLLSWTICWRGRIEQDGDEEEEAAAAAAAQRRHTNSGLRRTVAQYHYCATGSATSGHTRPAGDSERCSFVQQGP